jgi:hypothetical protein
MSISRTGLVVGVGFLALGLYLTLSAAMLPAGTGGLPGAGFFPQAIGVVIVLLAGAQLVEVFRGGDTTVFAVENRGAIASALGLTFLYLLLWGTGLFALRTFVFLAVFLRVLGETWRPSLTVAGVLTAAVTLAFQYGLRVSLE